jgi:hypothetical protein
MGNADYPSTANYSTIVDQLAIAEYLMGTFWDNSRKHSFICDKLMKAGVMHDQQGKHIDLKARVAIHAANYRSQGGSRTFSHPQQYVTYLQQASFYEIATALYEEETAFLETQGAVVKYNRELATNVGDDLIKGLNYQLLNSNATSNTIAGIAAAATSPIPITGIPSVFGYGATATGFTFSSGSGGASTASAVTAADLEVLPNVTYCNVATHPTSAIAGVDNKVPGATSPVIVNWSSTSFSSGSSTYTSNCLASWSRMISRLVAREPNLDGMPDTGIQTLAMHNQMRTALRSSTEQHIVLTNTPQSPDAGLYERLMIPYEGISIVVDTDQPTGVAYCLNLKKKNALLPVVRQRLAGMPDGMFKGNVKPIISLAQMPDINDGTFKLVAKIALNLILNPARQAMAYNFA